MKIIVSEKVLSELQNVNFDIAESIDRILGYVPAKDLRGISHVYVHDIPHGKVKKNKKLAAAYFRKQSKESAYIELYWKRLFGNIQSPEHFEKMLPIQEYGLATTLYHEVGHHVREIRTHRIKKNLNEEFAGNYADQILTRYILDNARKIADCFERLEKTAHITNIRKDVLKSMKEGWKNVYRKAISKSS